MYFNSIDSVNISQCMENIVQQPGAAETAVPFSWSEVIDVSGTKLINIILILRLD